MSEFRKIPEPDQAQWLDEEAAAVLAREVLAAAGRELAAERREAEALLHPEAFEILDVRQDEPSFFVEHWLIVGIWVVTMVAALWRIMI